MAVDALQVTPSRLETLLASYRRSSEHNRLETGPSGPENSPRRNALAGDGRNGEEDPLVEAGHEVLALALARPGLASRALREGVMAPDLMDEPIRLGINDFADETHARIFALLVEHAEDPGAILSDERARPLMDEISALQAAGERLYPSEASLSAAWFRLAALSREKAKLLTEDFDEKYRLHAEIKRLNAAAVEASNRTLES